MNAPKLVIFVIIPLTIMPSCKSAIELMPGVKENDFAFPRGSNPGLSNSFIILISSVSIYLLVKIEETIYFKFNSLIVIVSII